MPSIDFNSRLEAFGLEPLSKPMAASTLLCRPQMSYSTLCQLLGSSGSDAGSVATTPECDDPAVAEQVEIRIRYEAYIRKQEAQAERQARLEHLRIPEELDYEQVAGLRNEAREKLRRFRPATVGMASRIAGVTPADVAVLLVALERLRRHASCISPETTARNEA